jgi:type IV pilus assembly protein PilO
MTIRETKRVVMVAWVTLAVICLIAIGVLLSPLAKSREAKEAELRDYQLQFKDKEREVGPSRGMEKKISGATGAISKFYQQRLPAQYSEIDAALGKSAQDAGVQLQNITFKADKKAVSDLERVQISLTISGPYVNDVKFINAMERDRVFFVINSVTLAGSSNGVQLQLNAETYFRTGAA